MNNNLPSINTLLTVIPGGGSSHKQAEERALLFEKMTQSTPDILFVMDLYTKELLYINRPLETTLGFTKYQSAKMALPFFNVIHPADLPRVLAHLEEMKSASLDESREITYRVIDAKGRRRWIRDTNAVVKVDDRGRALEKTGILHDVTKENAAEEAIESLNRSLLRKNHALEAAYGEINSFTTIAANNYRDTLKNLYKDLEQILRAEAAKLSDYGKGNLRRLQSAIQKMNLLTDDLISFGKIMVQGIPEENIDLNIILGKAIDELGHTVPGINECIDKETLPVIKGFPDLAVLLFTHILDNCMKFTAPDKTPAIKVKYELIFPEAEINVGANLYHVISFIDNGPGVPEEGLSKIFEMFYRVPGKRLKGSGVGLPICRKIMDLHFGFIEAKNNEQGFAIECRFPSEA